MRRIKWVNGSHTEVFVVTGPVVERRQSEVIEDEVAI